jgi:predicted dehydrogenase
MGLVEAFVRAVEGGDPSLLAPLEEAVEAHRLVFLAERARKEGRVVEAEGGPEGKPQP